MAEQLQSPPLTPKRKRSGPGLTTSHPQKPVLDTSVVSLVHPMSKLADMDDSRGSQSPRTAMSSKFKDLGLASVDPMAYPAAAGQQQVFVDEDTEMADDEQENLCKRFKITNDDNDQEQPTRGRPQEDAALSDSSLSQQDPLVSIESDPPIKTKAAKFGTIAGARLKGLKAAGSPKKPRRSKSPPPPVPSSVSDLGSGSESPSSVTSLKKDPDPFVWQEWEITGHLALDADDDGYGINGIGFRPTPQTAEARLQRRKKQIAEWKSREAREQRQKRSERRYGASKTEEQNQPMPRRVSFAA